jgi:hypothetical protein
LSRKLEGKVATIQSRVKVKDNNNPTDNSSHYKSEDMEIYRIRPLKIAMNFKQN